MYYYLLRKINALGLDDQDDFLNVFKYAKGVDDSVEVFFNNKSYTLHTQDEVDQALRLYLFYRSNDYIVTRKNAREAFKATLFFCGVDDCAEFYWATPDKEIDFFYKNSVFHIGKVDVKISDDPPLSLFPLYTAFLAQIQLWLKNNYGLKYGLLGHHCSISNDGRVEIKPNAEINPCTSN